MDSSNSPTPLFSFHPTIDVPVVAVVVFVGVSTDFVHFFAVVLLATLPSSLKRLGRR
jgi:hypothetical protein